MNTITAPTIAHTKTEDFTFGPTDTLAVFPLVGDREVVNYIAAVGLWNMDAERAGFSAVSYLPSWDYAVVIGGELFDTAAEALAYATDRAGW